MSWYEICHPKRIATIELIDLISLLEPLLPVVEVHIIIGAFHTLRVILKSCEPYYISGSVQNSDR